MALMATTMLSTMSHGEDWPRWRGPDGTARSNETGLLKDWKTKKPLLHWTAGGLGDGYASVVVSKQRIFTIGKIDGKVYCFALQESSGRIIWRSQIGESGRIPMSTPTVDGKRVYALDPDGELSCLSVVDGNRIWHVDLFAKFQGRLMSGRGYGESPLIDGDRLICTPGGPAAMMVALDKLNGNVIWRNSMPDIGSKGRDGAAFSSIQVAEVGGKRQYVQLLGRGLAGFDAESGEFRWGFNDISNGTANIPTPIVDGPTVFSANGYHAGAVRLTLQNDGTKTNVREEYALAGGRFQNHHGGIVKIGQYIFGGHGSNNGLPTCIDFETGKVLWRRRGPGTGSASIVYADGRLYFRYQNGVMALLAADPKSYRLLGTFQIPGAGSDSWSHPVIANKRLLLRERDQLFSYGLTKGAASKQRTLSDPPPESVVSHFDGLPGATVQNIESMIPTAAPDKRRMLDSTMRRSDVVVRLSTASLTPEGTLRPEVFKQINDVDGRVFVDLSGTRLSDAGLRQLAKIESISSLSLDFCAELTGKGIASLGKMKRLEVLFLAGTRCTNSAISDISRLPVLRALDLEVCDAIDDGCCEALSQMDTLRVLSIKKTGFETNRISDKGMAQLASLRKLKYLNLYGNAVSDMGLADLARIGGLVELNLGLSAISDKGIRRLSGLRHLKHLDLTYSEGFGGVNVTDVSIDTFAKLKKLKSLVLIGAKITDRSIDRLGELKELVSINVTNSRLSKDGVDRLEQVLPRNCIIRY